MLDLKALAATLDQLETERRIPKEKIIEAIEQALAAAYKKDFGKRGQLINAKFDVDSGETHFQQVKIVVDETLARMPEELEAEQAKIDAGEEIVRDETDERFRFDEAKHLTVEDARRIKSDAQVGEELTFDLETEESFGRIAAQTAKQVIIQRLREAEKDSILEEYADKTGAMINGIVQKVEGNLVFIEFNRAIGILSKNEQIPGEHYRTGQRIKVFLIEVQESPRGVNLRVSRTHPLLVEHLFAIESPEVANGVVEIKSIAREPGSRSKIAVVSYDESVDPIGACVGQRGVRVSTVMNELSGEKIDIIPWSPEPAEFVAASLSPARVLDINLDEESHTAHVQVADDQLSLAIGKAGQNVRLAAKLTGWRIDIKGITPAADESSDDFFDDGMGEGAVSLTHPKKEDRSDDASTNEASNALSERVAETTAEETASE